MIALALHAALTVLALPLLLAPILFTAPIVLIGLPFLGAVLTSALGVLAGLV